MSADKTRAARLAEELEAQATWVPSGPAGVMHRSSAELRRLDASEAELIEALEVAMRYVYGEGPRAEIDQCSTTLSRAKGGRRNG